MGIIIRQSIKASLVTYIGVALGVVNQIFVATHFLLVSENGVTRSLLTFATLFSAIFSFGVAAISDRYFSHFVDNDSGNHGFLRFLLGYTLGGIAIFSLVYLGLHQVFVGIYQEKSPELIPFYYHIILFTTLLMLQTILESYCRNIRRITVPAFLREIFLRIINIAIILLYGFHFISFELFVTLFIGCYLLVVIGLLVYLQIIDKLHLPVIDRNILTKNTFQEMSAYGLIATIGAIGSNLCVYLDQLMLGAYKGQEDAGIFGIAMLIAMLIEVPRKSLTQISIPFISQAIQQKNWHEVESRNQNVSKHQLLAAGILMLFILCNLEDIFGILPKGDVYIRGKYVVILLILARMADMMGGMTSEIMGYSHFYRISTAFVVVLAVLTFITNSIFIPLMGITGAALATLITILCFTLARAFFIMKTLKINVFHFSGLLILGLCAAIYFLVGLIPSFGETFLMRVITIVIRCLVIFVIYFSVIWKIKLSEEFNGLVITLISQIKKRSLFK